MRWQQSTFMEGELFICPNFIVVLCWARVLPHLQFSWLWVMSRGHSSSSCSGHSWGMQNPRLSSHSGGFFSHGGEPTCNCGEVVVLRTTWTTKNGRRQFWGCHNYMVRSITLFLWFIHQYVVVANMKVDFCYHCCQ